jgi:von Willebrand factor type A domain-containing protein
MADEFESIEDYRAKRESRFFFPAIYLFVFALVVSSFIYGRSSDERIATLPVSEPTRVETTPEPPEPEFALEPVKSDVQVVLILDTSSSMDGLLAQARTQIWEIIAGLQEDENGKPRTIAVALYRYGSNRAPEQDGYLECLAPLSLDHEAVVEALKWLGAGGEKEYATMAVLAALKEQPWDLSPTIPKVIVVVGNENFFQGDNKFEEVLQIAKEKKIKLLPVYCVGKTASKSALSSWRRAANLADAELEVIDPNQVVANLETPIDKKILAKIAELQQLTEQESDKDGAQTLDEVLVRVRRPGGWCGTGSLPSAKIQKVESEIQALTAERSKRYAPKKESLGYSVNRGVTSVIKAY